MAQTVLVVGGTGFIGSSVCEKASLRGLRVLVISRGGNRPVWTRSQSWADNIMYCKGDARQPETMREHFETLHEQLVGCVSCVDGGPTNINIFKLCKEFDVPKFAVISRDRTSLDWSPFGDHGMRDMEQFLLNDEESRGKAVALVAGLVCGTRHLGVAPLPLDSLFCCVKRGKCCAVISVNDLSDAAVRFVTSDATWRSEDVLISNDKIPFFCRSTHLKKRYSLTRQNKESKTVQQSQPLAKEEDARTPSQDGMVQVSPDTTWQEGSFSRRLSITSRRSSKSCISQGERPTSASPLAASQRPNIEFGV